MSFCNASGGEARRIDFALLFAFRDIRRLQSNVQINLSVFDEFFDGSICGTAMVDIIEMLTQMADDNQEAYYIVTHRPDAIPETANKVILEKSSGITSIIS
jgi:DNA repair ATPase RecN